MPDLTQLRTALAARFPESWVRHHLDSLQPAYFVRFDSNEIAAHLQLLMELNDAHPVAIRARPVPGAARGEWWVEVVGYDCFQFLSTLCNLLAVRGFSIVEGQVFTSQPPPKEPSKHTLRRPGGTRPSRPPIHSHNHHREPDRRRKIVDVFRVELDPDAPAPDWDQFQIELSTLTRLLREGQFDEVHHRLIGRMVSALERHRPPADEGLEPLELNIDAEGSEFATVVRIGARDSFGFLYLTASALALCGIMIVQADIRTSGGRVDDTLWVTDRFGRKLTAEGKLRELRLSLILIEHFASRLPSATNPETALLHFSRFATETMARPNWAREFEALDRPEVLDALARVLGESDFLWEDFLHAHPEELLPMIASPDEWRHRKTKEELTAELENALTDATALDARCRVVARFKDREIFRADVRSILGMDKGLGAFSSELSDVAEVLVRTAYRLALEEMDADAPRTAEGLPAPSAVFALGKFGGRELGFASDLELMLVYADQVIVQKPAATSVSEYFDRLVSLLRTLLSTRRGGTFDLDFRLRPYGRGGPPATALSAFRNYYRAGGPAWGYERQALIKLRTIAGDSALAEEVEQLRDQFVYGPEPFDLAGYRRMRKLQVEQLVRPGTVNAKYSTGALVDVEYFVQAHQISHGSRDPSLRTPRTRDALNALDASGVLSPAIVETLRSAYKFFRDLIDALRVVHGQSKDLTVPAAGSEELLLLSRRMHFAEPAQLEAQLDEHLRAVRSLAERLGEFLGLA